MGLRFSVVFFKKKSKKQAFKEYDTEHTSFNKVATRVSATAALDASSSVTASFLMSTLIRGFVLLLNRLNNK